MSSSTDIELATEAGARRALTGAFMRRVDAGDDTGAFTLFTDLAWHFLNQSEVRQASSPEQISAFASMAASLAIKLPKTLPESEGFPKTRDRLWREVIRVWVGTADEAEANSLIKVFSTRAIQSLSKKEWELLRTAWEAHLEVTPAGEKVCGLLACPGELSEAVLRMLWRWFIYKATKEHLVVAANVVGALGPLMESSYAHTLVAPFLASQATKAFEIAYAAGSLAWELNGRNARSGAVVPKVEIRGDNHIAYTWTTSASPPPDMRASLEIWRGQVLEWRKANLGKPPFRVTLAFRLVSPDNQEHFNEVLVEIPPE